MVAIASVPLVVLGFLAFHLYFSPPFCANSVSCIKNLSGQYDPSSKEGVFDGTDVVVPSPIPDPIQPKRVLSEADGSGKRIEVDLTNQMLYAYQNDQLVMSFPISSGKWHPTPTGVFHIWIKLRYTTMEGGDPAYNDYYNLPNVPWTMYFYNDQVGKLEGYGLHGAYWHNNFGHPMSHGCINISLPNAQKLYDWVDPVTTGNVTYATDQNPGTMVVIYGAPPASEVSYQLN